MINYSQSIKISQLTQEPVNLLTLDDFLPIVDSGSLTTYRASLSSLKTFVIMTASIGPDTSIIFQTGSALTASSNLSYNYTNNILYVTGSINATSITSSIFGTSSIAQTASYALTSSYSTLISNAISSSYLSGSSATTNNFYTFVNGQKSGVYFARGDSYSDIYLKSTTSTNASAAAIYLAASGSTRSGNDGTDKVGVWIAGYTVTSQQAVPIYLGGNLFPSTNPSAAMTIDSSSNVGIQTMSPQAPLHVVGNTIITGYITSSGIVIPTSGSGTPTVTGSMFYSASKLFIYTGTGAAGGLTGWQTASLGG